MEEDRTPWYRLQPGSGKLGRLRADYLGRSRASRWTICSKTLDSTIVGGMTEVFVPLIRRLAQYGLDKDDGGAWAHGAHHRCTDSGIRWLAHGTGTGAVLPPALSERASERAARGHHGHGACT